MAFLECIHLFKCLEVTFMPHTSEMNWGPAHGSSYDNTTPGRRLLLPTGFPRWSRRNGDQGHLCTHTPQNRPILIPQQLQLHRTAPVLSMASAPFAGRTQVINHHPADEREFINLLFLDCYQLPVSAPEPQSKKILGPF